MPITYRGTKGSALTYEELDENFAWLANNSSGNVNTSLFLANTSGTVFEGNLIVTGSITANNLTGNGTGNYLANTSGAVFRGDLYVTGNVIIGQELFPPFTPEESGLSNTTVSVSNGTFFITGNTVASGNVTITGNTVAANIIPAINENYDLGTPTLGWRRLYLAANAIIDFNNTDNQIIHDPLGLSFYGGYVYIERSAGNTTAPLQVVNAFNGPNKRVAYFEFERDLASIANNDTGYLTFYGQNSIDGQTELARIAWSIIDITDGSEDGNLTFFTSNNGTLAAKVAIQQGLSVGSPTGGDKGVGFINAVGVYDDNALLTCYIGDVVDLTTGENITMNTIQKQTFVEKWDAVVPSLKIVGGTKAHADKQEEIIPDVIVERQHFGARKFLDRLDTEYDPRDITKAIKHFKDKKHLTPFPNPDTWEHNSMSTGQWIQRLIEQAELNALWAYKEHMERVKLETYVQSLEARIIALESKSNN